MDPAYLSTVVSDDLPVLTAHLPQGSLRGLDVVHLQCHIGTDTISLARAGGRMTGVDFSPSSLAAARRLADTTGDEVTWVESDVLDARAAVTGGTTYVGDGRLTSTRTYEFPHPVSETIGAVLGAGLVLERYDEGRALPWRFSDRMVEASPERYAWPEDERDLVPCTFTLVARKPAPGGR